MLSATDNAGDPPRRALRRRPGRRSSSGPRTTPPAGTSRARRARRGSRSRARTSRARRSAPRRCRPAGGSSLVRTIDAAGNSVDRGPFPVDVATPSDRGARNGVGRDRQRHADRALPAAASGRARTVDYGTRVRVGAGSSTTPASPIAGAELALLTTNDRPGASTFTRKRFRTAGRRHVRHRARAGARRSGWRSPGSRTSTTRPTRRPRGCGCGTRADRHAARRPRAGPALGRAVTLRGHLRAPARGVTVILQGRRRRRRALSRRSPTRRPARGGRFGVAYRFRDAGSRGRTFRFRAKLRAGAALPVRDRLLAARVTVRVR